MSRSHPTLLRALRLIVLGTATVALLRHDALGVVRPQSATLRPNYDVRLPSLQDAKAGVVVRAPSAEQKALADAFRGEIPGLTFRWDGMSGSPKWISAPAGAVLAPPSASSPGDAARAFLRSNAGLYGMTVAEIDALRIDSIVPTRDGDAHVHFVQMSGGIEVFGGGANVNFLPNGSIDSVGGHLWGGVRAEAKPSLTAVDAARAAQADVYPALPVSGTVVSREDGPEQRTVLDATGFGRPPVVRLVLFPEREGARLAWEVNLAETTLETSWRVLVDALDGSILFRVNETLYASARYLNAGYPDPESDEIAPPQLTLASIPSSTAQSPAGWITASTALSGNNATSHLLYWTQPGLSDPAGIYDYPFDSMQQGLVNAWWWVNDAHDRFYAVGFDEPAGNFQQDNFGRGGLPGDPVAVAQWASGGRNNAFFTPAVDGSLSTANFFWTDCRFCGDHDGYPENGGDRNTSNMRDVVVHEYTHGVSMRLVGGPARVDCLNGIQSGGMGEGWSDLFAASFYGDPRIGGHFFEGNGWMRDLRHDLTYGDLCHVGDHGCEVHADGQIWAGALWDLRQSMVALDPVNGLEQFHRIVVKGMANTVCFPDMLDARDGILNADAQLYTSAHKPIIWNVFASRGMGSTASSTGENDSFPVASTAVPSGLTCTAPAIPTGVSATSGGANVITVAYTAPGASSVEIRREEVDNPFDAPVVVGYAVPPAAYSDATVQAGKTYRYSVVALGNAGTSCRSGASATSDASTTGTCAAYPIFDPQLSIADGSADCTLTLSWSAAAQGCPGTPQGIVYGVYRANTPGFEPSERLLIGRTTATTFQDEPPQTTETYYYLVLAQHGTVADPADHRSRGSSQVLKWVPRIPTLGRVATQTWDFDAGPAGWTVNNGADASGGWTLANSTPPTRYGNVPFTPSAVAGGSGRSWFTGQGNASVTSNDSDGRDLLISPSFDGTGGKTLLSFDYWCHVPGLFFGGIIVRIGNGSTTVDVMPIGMMTAQGFDTATDRGWQRAELNLANYVTPTATMTVTFVGANGNPLSEFAIDNVRIEQATLCARSALRISSVLVDDAQPGWGNGNHILEPGETARLRFKLVNDGPATATTPTGVLAARTPGVLVHEPQDTFPTIAAAGGVGMSSGTGFTVTAPSVLPCGGTLDFDLVVTDAANTVSRLTRTIESGYAVQDVVFTDTFATDLGWTAGGAVGRGVWQRGDPVGTINAGTPANPENDSPNDPDSFCYVTENGPVGGTPETNDVDGTGSTYPWLDSPAFSLAGYKRTHFSYDVWYYDNSSSRSYWEDYGEVQMYVNDGIINAYDYRDEGASTGGWKSVSFDPAVPMVPNHHIYVFALDEDSSWCSGCQDDIVEMGIDNVRVTADRPACDAATVTHPPNGIGDTLRVNKSATVDLVWTGSPVDGAHDAPAYYRLHVSGAPSGGFGVADTTTTTSDTRPLAGPSECYLISAVNQAGASADSPTP